MDGNDLGKIIEAWTAQGQLQAGGTAIGYSDAPMMAIRTWDGDVIWWRADMCKEVVPVKEAEPLDVIMGERL